MEFFGRFSHKTLTENKKTKTNELLLIKHIKITKLFVIESHT